MNYRQLGRSGLQVSEISVGCSGYWGQAAFAEAEAANVIHQAVERGVNFFDTGHHYCSFNAEPRLGRILRPLIAGAKRDEIVISSKATDGAAAAGRAGPLQRFRRQARPRDYSPDYVEATCAASIRNLGCGHLDVFQLHGIREDEITDELVERLMAMKRHGMFRALGVNTHSESLNRFVASRPEVFDMVLIDYNVLQLDREPVIEALGRAGVGVVAGTVLAQAHLVPGKIGSLRRMSDLWYLARATLKPASRRLGEVARGMRETLASIDGVSAAQAAFRYVLDNPNVSSCVFGTTRVGNLLEIVDSVERSLPAVATARIRATFDAMPRKISE